MFTVSVFAQAPEKMSYQAVIRDVNSNLMVNQGIGMQISILQGSLSGIAVYVERQFPNTNANGLVSVEIGTGTLVSGDFTTIDWTTGPYFIKTEIDLNGGANYTIMGTSQLLSVPYALHAKTAESITGGITETDPIYTAWDKSYNDLTDKPSITDSVNAILDTTTQFVRTEVDGSVTNEIQTISRTGLTVSLSNGGGTYQDSINTYAAGDGINITNNVVSEHKYQIGDFAQGGIVFWLDETGEHGLVCAKSDLDGGYGERWAGTLSGTLVDTQAKGDGPYAGETNTAIIIAVQVANGTGGFCAARTCNELVITENGKTYGDWYLPSKEELNLMYENKETIDATATSNGGTAFASSKYWSSTEYDDNAAYYQDFSDGFQGNANKITFKVRAIRSF